MDLTRRSFLIASGSVVMRPALAASGPAPTIKQEASNLRVFLPGAPSWLIMPGPFGPLATLNLLTAPQLGFTVDGASLRGGAQFTLRFDFIEAPKGYAARLTWTGWPGPALVAGDVPLAAFLAGRTPLEAQLPLGHAAVLVAGTTDRIVRSPRYVHLVVSRPPGRQGLPDPLATASIDLVARRGRFRLPLEVSAQALRLAPAPATAGPDWRADLIGSTLPNMLALGRSRSAAVLLVVLPSASASVLAGPRPLQLKGDLRVHVDAGGRREGPVRCAAVRFGSSGRVNSTALELWRGHWGLELRRGLFGVGGANESPPAGPPKPMVGRIETRSGRIHLFDVTLMLHDHGINVAGTDYSRLDFKDCACALRLAGVPGPPTGDANAVTLLLGASARQELSIPLARAALRIAHARTLLSLRFRFKDFHLLASDAGTSLVPDRVPAGTTAKDPLLVVDFPPQHLAERAYLRQDAPLPDRDVPIPGPLLRAARSRDSTIALSARQAIAKSKLDNEAKDEGLDGIPTAQRPFALFSTAWETTIATGMLRELPWIGPQGLLSAEARQRARVYAADARRKERDAVRAGLEAPPAKPADLATLLDRAAASLPLPALGYDTARLRTIAASAATADAAVAAILGQAEQRSEAHGNLQKAWRACTPTHPLPFTSFFTAHWPSELSTQAQLDAILPSALVGKAPNRVPDLAAAAFLAAQLKAVAELEGAEAEPFARPNEARLSGPSRLAFVAPHAVALTLAALTDWSSLELRVVRRAYQPYRIKDGHRSKEDRIGEILRFQGIPTGTTKAAAWMAAVAGSASAGPNSYETALEVPSRLLLSPSQDARWTTPRRPPAWIEAAFAPDPGWSIWQAELFESDPDAPSLRAIWSPDFRPEALTDPNAWAPPEGAWAPWALPRNGSAPSEAFRSAIDARDRHELVGLTSVYGMPALARRNGKGILSPSQARIPDGFAIDGLDLPDETSLYLPQALAPRRLAMSSLGASLDLDQTFKPPAAALAKAVPKSAALYRTFNMARLSIQMGYGYDEVVEVVHKGFLCPCGHPAAFVKTTRQEIGSAGGPVAYPVQRLTVQVAEAAHLYGTTAQRHEGRGLPAKTITLLTLRTPDLLDPTASTAPISNGDRLVHNALGKVGGVAGQVFWPRTEPTEAGNVKFRMRIDDSADPVYMPLLFLDNEAAHDADTVQAVTERYYNRPATETDPPDLTRWNVVRHGGATRTYAAPNRPGDTEYATDWQEIDVEGREGGRPYAFDPVLEGLDQPPFFPRMRMAQIRARQVGQLTGQPPPPTFVVYDDTYLADGFGSEARENPPVMFLEVRGARPRLDMDKQGDRAGGTGRPSQEIAGFSRLLGPVGAGPSTPLAAARPVRYAQRQDVVVDGAPLAGVPASPGGRSPASFFDEKATLLGLVRLNALIALLLAEADGLATGNKALPILKEVVDYAEQAGSQALATLRTLIVEPLSAELDKAHARDAGYVALDDRVKDLAEALKAAEHPNAKDDLPGLLAAAWAAGQRLAAELRVTAKSPLAPLDDMLVGGLKKVEAAWRDALTEFNPQKLVRQEAAKQIAALASSSDWAAAVVSTAASAGLAPAEATAVADAIRTAAADPSVWLAAQPLDALADKARRSLPPPLPSRIEADLLRGPLFSDLEKVAKSLVVDVDATLVGAASAVAAILEALDQLGKRYRRISASAAALCADGTAALRSWIQANVPAAAPDPALLGSLQAAGVRTAALADDLARLVEDLPKSDRDAAQPFIDWSRIRGAAIRAVADRIKGSADTLSAARADLLATLGPGGGCASTAGLAGAVDRFDANRRELALACNGWAEALGASPPPPGSLSGDPGQSLADAAKALRAGSAAAVNVVRQSSLGAMFNGAGLPPPVADVIAKADAARQVVGDPPYARAAALKTAAAQVKSVANEAARQAASAAATLDGAAHDAGVLLHDLETARQDLEAAGRDALESVLQAALAQAAEGVADAAGAATATASSGARSLYKAIVDARRAAFDLLRPKDAQITALLGTPPPGPCSGTWAETLLVLPVAGACSVADDRLTREAAEVATPDGFAVAVSRWTKAPAVQPAPLDLLKQSSDVAVSGVKAAVTRVLDIDGLRRTLEDQLRKLVPLRRTLSYDMTLPLRTLDLSFLVLTPKGGDLVLESRTIVSLDLAAKPSVTATFKGTVPAFNLDIKTAIAIDFEPITYTGGTGQAGKLDARVSKVTLGSSIKFLEQLGTLLGRHDQGPYVILRHDRPAIEAGYLLSIGTFTIGNLAIININFAAACILPFDGTDARFSFSLGTLDQPFLLSAAPYGGGGFFGLEAGAHGITAGAASFEYGGVAAISYGLLEGIARITTGVYVRQAGGATELTGLFFAGFSAHIACFGIASSFTLRLSTEESGGLTGEATLKFTFSVGIASLNFEVSVRRHMDQNFKKAASLSGTQHPMQFASLDPQAALPCAASAKIITRGADAAIDWRGHEAYYDHSLRPAEALP